MSALILMREAEGAIAIAKPFHTNKRDGLRGVRVDSWTDIRDVLKGVAQDRMANMARDYADQTPGTCYVVLSGDRVLGFATSDGSASWVSDAQVSTEHLDSAARARAGLRLGVDRATYARTEVDA